MKVADALEDTDFKQGDYIIRQGTRGKTFYILISGEVEVTVKETDTTGGANEERTIRTLVKGDYFGEKALRSESGLRSSNIIALSAKVCWCLLLYICCKIFSSIFNCQFLLSQLDVHTNVREIFSQFKLHLRLCRVCDQMLSNVEISTSTLI